MARRRDNLPYEPLVIDASAPPHDPSQDKPMSRDSLTPTATWANIFRNTPGSTYVSTQPSASAPQIINPVPVTQAPAALPSLTQFANGGLNHAQKWMTPEQGLASVQKYIQPGPVTAPAFTTYDKTPGTRKPFITGADGLNVGPSIAAKVNPNDPTLNKDYLKFSWSSAFR